MVEAVYTISGKGLLDAGTPVFELPSSGVFHDLDSVFGVYANGSEAHGRSVEPYKMQEGRVQLDVRGLSKYGVPERLLEGVEGRVHDVSAEYLAKIGEPEAKHGCNDGVNVYVDRNLPKHDYLMVLLHELGHFKTADQAGAQECATMALKDVLRAAKRYDAQEIEVLGRNYGVDTVEKALDRAVEIGNKFPGFKFNMN